MRVLVINYEMDRQSAVLAYQARVVEALNAHLEQVVVISEKVGDLELSDSIVVERSALIQSGRLRRYRALYDQVYRLCKAYQIDAVFIHMAHRYSYRLFPLFKILRLPVLLWYAHMAVNWHMRLALLLSDRVITANVGGFPIQTSKVHAIGHGVSADIFQLVPRSETQDTMITVSRLSRRKRLDVLIDLVAYLRDIGQPKHLKIVGASLTDDDRTFEAELFAQIERHRIADLVNFAGFVPMDEVPAHYHSAFVHLNVCDTTAMDKAVLESLACGCPVLTSNSAFFELLTDFPDFCLTDESLPVMAERVQVIFEHRTQISPERLRSLIVGQHDRESYARRIVKHLAAIS